MIDYNRSITLSVVLNGPKDPSVIAVIREPSDKPQDCRQLDTDCNLAVASYRARTKLSVVTIVKVSNRCRCFFLLPYFEL